MPDGGIAEPYARREGVHGGEYGDGQEIRERLGETARGSEQSFCALMTGWDVDGQGTGMS
jgi:hypothetical protein